MPWQLCPKHLERLVRPDAQDAIIFFPYALHFLKWRPEAPPFMLNLCFVGWCISGEL